MHPETPLAEATRGQALCCLVSSKVSGDKGFWLGGRGPMPSIHPALKEFKYLQMSYLDVHDKMGLWRILDTLATMKRVRGLSCSKEPAFLLCDVF